MAMRVWTLVVATTVASCSGSDLPRPANLCEEPGARCVSAPARDVVAVDGDTFELQRLTDRGLERIRLRLIDWDSPETGQAANCAEEDALGQKVEVRARQLFEAGQSVSFLADGQDRFGRVRAHVYLDGVHIGWLLSKDGLSAPWDANGARPDWCSG